MLNHSDPSPSRPSTPSSTEPSRRHADAPGFTDRFSADWCVGSDPVRWDVPFTVRLMQELKRLFRRRELTMRSVPVPAQTPPAAAEQRVSIRLAPVVTDRARQAA